jgi:2'-5' RNA ligase
VTAPGETALIIPVRLPPSLERLRQDGLDDAPHGLPAHLTLLFPFAPPDALDAALQAHVRRVVGGHRAFIYALTHVGQWPDTAYIAVDPEPPFRALQADLAASFPAWPLYRGAFEFTPHVTIAGGPAAGAAELLTVTASAALPAARTARFVDLIVREGARWTLRSRFPLDERSLPGR